MPAAGACAGTYRLLANDPPCPKSAHSFLCVVARDGTGAATLGTARTDHRLPRLLSFFWIACGLSVSSDALSRLRQRQYATAMHPTMSNTVRTTATVAMTTVLKSPPSVVNAAAVLISRAGCDGVLGGNGDDSSGGGGADGRADAAINSGRVEKVTAELAMSRVVESSVGNCKVSLRMREALPSLIESTITISSDTLVTVGVEICSVVFVSKSDCSEEASTFGAATTCPWLSCCAIWYAVGTTSDSLRRALARFTEQPAAFLHSKD